MAEPEQQTLLPPEPPVYSFTKPSSVQRVAVSSGNDQPHDGRSTSSRTVDFVRFAKWCPDGTAALVLTESQTTRILARSTLSAVNGQGADAYLNPLCTVPNPSPTWSTLWYPTASLSSPATFCYVSGNAGAPVKLMDGVTGKTRASYPIINQNEQFVAPSAMAFDSSAAHLYCGFDSAIEVFDFNCPGAPATRLKTCPTRKSREGQKGIISALAFSPDGSGTFAAGSYSGSISLYGEDSGEDRLAEIEMGESSAGLTQLAFHPMNPVALYAASRMSNHISVFDLRNVNAGPIMKLERPGRTQQKIYFDMDWCGRYLATGGTDGQLRVYDVGSQCSTDPIWQQTIDKSTIGSVSLHPFERSILTACGSRRFTVDMDGSDSETDSESDSSTSSDSNGSNIPFVNVVTL